MHRNKQSRPTCCKCVCLAPTVRYALPSAAAISVTQSGGSTSQPTKQDCRRNGQAEPGRGNKAADVCYAGNAGLDPSEEETCLLVAVKRSPYEDVAAFPVRYKTCFLIDEYGIPDFMAR